MATASLDVNGIRMRWEENGDGFPVILLHGIPTSPRLWRNVLPRLEGARGLAWEMVGYGDSIPEGRDRDISVAKQADYLVEWMDALGIDRAAFVGHDLGGGVAQIAALKHPDRYAGLLLTNSIGYDSWPIRSVAAMRALGGVVEHMPDAAFKQVLRSFLHMGHDNEPIADESVETHWRAYERHEGAAAFIRQTRSLRTEDTLAVQGDLPRLGEQPVRVIWGDQDGFQEVSHGERLARDLGVTLSRIAGGKHFTPEDHPEAISDAINGLVRDVEQMDVAHERREPTTRGA